MQMQDYIDEIKLELTGGVLELELPDTTLAQVVNKALREVQRYITSTELMTIPYSKCIDLKNSKISSVVKVYRTEGYGILSPNNSETSNTRPLDPLYAQTWMMFSKGNSFYNLNDYLLNFASYNTLMQIRNTLSTDLAFKYDKQAEKLYINVSEVAPARITIEYIPVINDVSDIKSDYWIDIITRLSVALTKQILGRIRSRFTQSNALWTMDGAQMLSEGAAELQDLRDRLTANAQLVYPID